MSPSRLCCRWGINLLAESPSGGVGQSAVNNAATAAAAAAIAGKTHLLLGNTFGEMLFVLFCVLCCMCVCVLCVWVFLCMCVLCVCGVVLVSLKGSNVTLWGTYY